MTYRLLHKFTIFAITAACLVGLLAITAQPTPAYAQTTAPCSGNPTNYDPAHPCIGTGGVDSTGKVNTKTQDSAASNKSGLSLINNYLNPLINFLAGVVGLVATISIVMGGIQYASSTDDPQKVAKAKSRIINAILGLLAFLLLYTFLQWITPGGFL